MENDNKLMRLKDKYFSNLPPGRAHRDVSIPKQFYRFPVSINRLNISATD
jgi:hypothetical protein